MKTLKRSIPFVWRELWSDRVEPRWPKGGASLKVVEDSEQRSFKSWQDIVLNEVVRLNDLEEAVAEIEETPSWQEEERMKYVMNAWAALNLSDRILAAARRKIYGSVPGTNEDGEWLFCWQELLMIAAAFWPCAARRLEYVSMVNCAEIEHKRAKAAERIFAELEAELKP